MASKAARLGAARRRWCWGPATRGHDVAQDLHSHGVDTTIIQRGSTTVVSIEPSAKMNYALYEEGPPLEDCDLIGTATTYPLMIRGYQAGVKRMVEADKDDDRGAAIHRLSMGHRRG